MAEEEPKKVTETVSEPTPTPEVPVEKPAAAADVAPQEKPVAPPPVLPSPAPAEEKQEDSKAIVPVVPSNLLTILFFNRKIITNSSLVQ